MKDYKKFRKEYEKINKNMEIFEKAISKEDKDKIDRLLLSGDHNSALKKFTNLIDELKAEIETMDFDEILFDKKRNNLEIMYSSKIRGILVYLDGKRVELEYSQEEEKQKIVDFIYQNNDKDIYLDIDINPPFNRIDINNNLPVFMRGLGLGQKIYKKLIKDFNYISTFKGFKPSIWSTMVWNKIADDHDLYFFANDDNFICFWNEVEYDIIVNKLKEFYKENGQRVFDNDFKVKYNLTDDKINKIFK